MMRLIRRLLGGLTLLALGGCVGAAREAISSFSSLSGDETVVVGKVELVPALRKNEQQIRVMNSGMFEKKLFLILDSQNRKLTQEPTRADYAGRIESTLGETFFVRSSAQPFYVVGGMMYLELGPSTNQAYFPGGLKASLKSGDKAVYVGTIQYHRNEFFEITKVTVVDDYERANAEFKKRFGNKHQLRKALLTSTK